MASLGVIINWLNRGWPRIVVRHSPKPPEGLGPARGYQVTGWGVGQVRRYFFSQD